MPASLAQLTALTRLSLLQIKFLQIVSPPPLLTGTAMMLHLSRVSLCCGGLPLPPLLLPALEDLECIDFMVAPGDPAILAACPASQHSIAGSTALVGVCHDLILQLLVSRRLSYRAGDDKLPAAHVCFQAEASYQSIRLVSHPQLHAGYDLAWLPERPVLKSLSFCRMRTVDGTSLPTGLTECSRLTFLALESCWCVTVYRTALINLSYPCIVSFAGAAVQFTVAKRCEHHNWCALVCFCISGGATPTAPRTRSCPPGDN